MVERVVRYLRDAGVPFRTASYPMPEPAPAVAHPLGPGVHLVDTRVILVDGRPAIACTPHDVPVNLSALANVLSATVLDLEPAQWAEAFAGAHEPLPPLAGIFGVPLFVDDEVAASARIVFRAFSPTDFVELMYDDFAFVERPRVASFGLLGELPPKDYDARR